MSTTSSQGAPTKQAPKQKANAAKDAQQPVEKIGLAELPETTVADLIRETAKFTQRAQRNAPAERIDIEELATLQLGRWKKARLQARVVSARDDMQHLGNVTFQEQREDVLRQLKVLVENGGSRRAFPKHLGGDDDHGGNIAAFEELVTANPSMQIKSGVQWGLFGAAVLHLGTRPHHDRWLPAIMRLDLPGVFAMTEIGHGSDVASIGTTATYDEKTGEFVINTPFRAAWKDYLGNAAKHGRAAVVFAQLITKGVNHGVHCFFVPIRDENGEMLPGVQSEDDGLKGGLNGIDNGRLAFDHVRVPRENLLNRYGDVAADGTYSSSIDSPGRRFFTMLGTLVQGRVSLDGAAVAASKLALEIAITYASQRRQFPGDGGRETVLLDYGQHQRRLLTRLATTFASGFAHEEFLQLFDAVFSGEKDTPEQREDLETMAAAFKSLSTWHALDTLQECREACGGAGFMAENRFVSLRADLDVYSTFEGDNTVLLQLVGKRLLKDYGAQFKGASGAALAKFAAGEVAGRAYRGLGIRSLVQDATDVASRKGTAGGLRDESVQRDLLEGRARRMVADLANRMRKASSLSAAEANALFQKNQHLLIETARAHAEFMQWRAFTRAIAGIEDATTRRVMRTVRDLFGLELIEKHLGWHTANGMISTARARALPDEVERLIREVRPHALDLVTSFGYTDKHARATIFSGVEEDRQEEAKTYFDALRASGEAPVNEKDLKKKSAKK